MIDMLLLPSCLPQYAIYIGLIAISFSLQILEARAASHQHVDGTLNSGFNGVNVVVAVIEKINASQVFESYNWFRQNKGNAKVFLRRMAYVESEDGRIMKPGGIWNIISEDELRKTQVYADQTYVSPGQTLRQRIQDSPLFEFVDWMNVTFSDPTNNLSIPLYSGLATMIRLHIRLVNNYRGELSNGHRNQAQLWKEDFNGTANATDRWDEAEDYLTRNEDCPINTDVVFVVDASNSISENNLTQARNMMYKFTNNTISDEHEDGYNKIGIVLIRSTAIVYHPLQCDMNKTSLLNRINDLPYEPGEYTNTADGLCKMSRQAWRDDPNVLHLAIVITDGRSNYISDECRGGTEHVANLIHTEYPRILVMAIGIGHRIDITELLLIASGRHLVVELAEYKETVGIPASLRYQICYTLSEPITKQEENRPVLMARNQIMRWVRHGVGGEGVTIRLCIWDGKVTLYVSSLPNPSDAGYDYRETITPDDHIATPCITKHFRHHRPISVSGRTRRDEVPEASVGTVYITIVGQDNSSLVTLQTADGNITFDVNECEQEHLDPCDKSAICHNTDGSFYCECQTGFSGDGFECTGQTVIHSNRIQLDIILPSSLLCVIILLSLLAVLVSIIAWRNRKKDKSMPTRSAHPPRFHQSEIKLAKASLKKVGNTFSATNAIFEK